MLWMKGEEKTDKMEGYRMRSGNKTRKKVGMKLMQEK